MRESQLRFRVIKALKGHHPIAVENSVLPGTPDVNYVEGWVELKQLGAWPKVKDEVIILVPKFTPQQRIWLRTRWQAGGAAYFLIVIGKDWLLFDGDVAADFVGRCDKKTLLEKSKKHWPKGPNMEELVCLLITKR